MTLRFVILRHEGVPDPHFDLMFETAPGSPLTTWRSPAWPIDRPTPLVRLGEHRRAYLDYEGPISRDRGFVRRVEAGTCRIDRADDGTFWTVRFPDESPAPLSLKRVDAEQWLAVPACGS